MKITQAGIDLIRRFEGFRGTAYRCPSGVWTIGYGHTSNAGAPKVMQGMTMTEADAGKTLASDIQSFASGVRSSLQRRVSDDQFSALVSFAFNVGLDGFRSSSVKKAVDSGDFDAVPRRLGLWVKGGGRILPGLIKRRAAEAELFMSAGNGAASPDAEHAEPAGAKPALRSTTIASAMIAAVAAVLSGGLSSASGFAGVAIVLTAVSVAAAAWIIRERLKKLHEEGI
jgi:lysozyme